MHKRNFADCFVPGQVWESPRGSLYTVIGYVEKPGKRKQAVLRLGENGQGRKQLRDWDAVVGWVIHRAYSQEIAMWKDTTRYSRGERGKKEPNCFTTKSGPISISVTTGHIHHPGRWVMNCSALGIKGHELFDCGNLEEAKRMAVALVRVLLTEMRRNVDIIAAET